MAASETYSYGPHCRQKILVYTSQNDVQRQSPLWVIYIHGGAWRDPNIYPDSFSTAHALLCKHPLIQTNVTGFASLDYRLSPHPDFPQDPNNTPQTELRVARHPDHIQDIQTALELLQQKYAFGENYILVGHSCGATLAFQVVMDKLLGTRATTFPKPIGIVGVCGIYDLRLLRDDFKHVKIYDDFTRGAFGTDEELWDAVSPARASVDSDVVAGWKNGRVAILASSRGDSLINPAQADVMSAQVLLKWKAMMPGRTVVEIADLTEEHDDVWKKGEELARIVTVAVQEVINAKVL